MTLTELDRSIFEHIRLKVVEFGYLPDITQYNTVDEYDNARLALAAQLQSQGSTMIDVLGVGSWESRGEKTDAKIVVNRRDINPGEIGTSGSYVFTPITDDEGVKVGYTKSKLPTTTSHTEYEIRYNCSSVKMERIIIQTLDIVFGRSQKELHGIKEDGSKTEDAFTSVFQGLVDVTNKEFIEGFLRIVASDVMMENELEDEDITVPPLRQINANLYAVKRDDLEKVRNGDDLEEIDKIEIEIK